MGAGMDSLVVDVVEVNVIVGAGMDSLVVYVVEVNVIMGAGMHSLVCDFAVNNSPERRAMENGGEGKVTIFLAFPLGFPIKALLNPISTFGTARSEAHD